MRHRLQTYVILVAWLLATGCQWDLAQVVAWGRMFTDYSREMTLVAAAQKTFSGEMCAMCRAVQKGKQAQETSGARTPDAKFSGKLVDLCPISVAAKIVSPVRAIEGLVLAPLPIAGELRASPPNPPPRAVA